MGHGDLELEVELESRVREQGFDLVSLEWGGSKRRPVLRVRIDLPGSEPGHGVTVDDCASLSRTLERWLEGWEEIPDRYVLEVSSPGVERPLRRVEDWMRFRGKEVVVKGKEPLWRQATRLEGEVVAVESEEEGTRVCLRVANGEEIWIPLAKVTGAHLHFRWK